MEFNFLIEIDFYLFIIDELIVTAMHNKNKCNKKYYYLYVIFIPNFSKPNWVTPKLLPI
jgi:hypothetical protein